LEALGEGTRVFSEREYFSAARSDFSGGYRNPANRNEETPEIFLLINQDN